VRLEAVRLFEQGVGPAQVAGRLRVNTKLAYQWRRRWRPVDSGTASKGPGGAKCRPSRRQLERLRTELDRGPAFQDLVTSTARDLIRRALANLPRTLGAGDASVDLFGSATRLLVIYGK
jgi:transposase-like protein